MNRLEIILKALYFDQRYAVGQFARVNIIQEIREFSLMSGDKELEGLCDEKLSKENV